MKLSLVVASVVVLVSSVSYASGAKKPADTPKTDFEKGVEVLKEGVTDKDKPSGPGREQSREVMKELDRQSGTEGKSSEGKSTEGKSSEGKSTEGKASEGKSKESKGGSEAKSVSKSKEP